MNINRRHFAKAVAATCLPGAYLAPRSALAQQAPSTASTNLRFPDGFVWGCATSAYQIEGAISEDGRGASIWDTFSHSPNATHAGDNGDIADDSYHRYKTDVALLRQLGAKAYRFSISWPRIFPHGKGKPNAAGLAYYQRLVDELLAQGIQPYVTLFHWDLPQALHDGWLSRDTSYAFAEYAAFVAKHLSDRVSHFMTTNELVCFTDLGYKIGQFAPGLKLDAASVNQVRHHGVLAHGLGVQAIRANAPSRVQVGLAENARVFVPVIDTDTHTAAALAATREENAQFLTVIMEGRYTDAYLSREGANAPTVKDGDLKAISAPLDFLGHNVYQPDYVCADASPSGYQIIPKADSFPHMPSPWLTVGPEAIYWAVRNVSRLWKPSALYITENGCSAEDKPNAEGKVMDTDRVMFLRNYLTHLHRAVSEGFPVKGYFLWSLLDNFEWADGYDKRFGIYYVDYATKNRSPKLSADWYREVIARNSVL